MINLSISEMQMALAGAAGLSFLFVPSAAVQWRRRRRNRRELADLREAIERQQMASLEMFSEVHRSVAMLEEGLRGVRETPKAGVLNRSARAQALQLLRSGLSAETAGPSLGIGKREMRLLERVSQTLCRS
jgi:hypothetical protein